jgi:hypothetical protein
MSWFKTLTRSTAAQEATNALLTAFCRVVHLTGRREVRHAERRDAALALAGGRVIYAVWHARLQMFWALPEVDAAHTHALASGHRDGRLIARMMERFGFRIVTGSTSKGGAQALREMIRVVRGGDKIVITPDGPRGPARIVQQGAVALARASGVPILPVGISGSRTRTLDSWDRMQLTLPFARRLYVFGEPVVVPKDADDLEVHCRILAAALDAATAEADAATGYVAPPPGPNAARKGMKS